MDENILSTTVALPKFIVNLIRIDASCTVALLVLIVWWIYWNSLHRRKSKIVETFPGPKALPIFGNFFNFALKTPEDAMKLTSEYHKEFGGIYRLRAFDLLGFMVTNPKIIEIVLGNSTKYSNKTKFYGLLKPWLGDGLLLSKGQKWFKRRKLITPAFHFNILKQFVDVFDRQSDVLVDILDKYCTEKTINIQPFITLMTLDVVCEAAMGVRIDSQINKHNEYVMTIDNIARITTERMTKMWMQSNLLFCLFATEKYRSYKKSIVTLKEFTNSIIRQRRKEIQKQTPDELVESTEFSVSSRMTLMDILLRSSIDGEPLTDEAICEEVDTFMFAGHETTTAGILFTLYLISRHKSVQDRLFDEITRTIGNKTEPVTYQQLTGLKYMEMVIKESFRLYPPVPLIGRHLENDVVLDDDRVLPADTHFILLLFDIFRNPKYFENPDEFDPERFNNLNENMNPYLFIPFSAGSRNCIGQKFAMLEVKSTISKILRYYELLPMGDAPDVVMQLTLRSKNGVQLGLKVRSY